MPYAETPFWPTLFPSMSPDKTADAATLSDLVTACSKVMDFIHGANRSDLDHNQQMLSACCYQIAVIGEAPLSNYPQQVSGSPLERHRRHAGSPYFTATTPWIWTSCGEPRR
jgi:hypothetical protein